MPNDEEDEGSIHRVDTIPPPDGEKDPYNAPTKVGAAKEAVVSELMHAAERRAGGLAKREAANTPPLPATPPLGDDVPRVYDEVDDDDVATLLSKKAKPPIFVPSNNTAPLAPAFLADVIASVDARARAASSRPPEAGAPEAGAPEAGWSRAKLAIVAVIAVALFLGGLIAFFNAQ